MSEFVAFKNASKTSSLEKRPSLTPVVISTALNFRYSLVFMNRQDSRPKSVIRSQNLRKSGMGRRVVGILLEKLDEYRQA